MAEIFSFNGIRYNQSLAGDLASLICPPYDIITPEMQHELYQRSEYNFVRLEHGWDSPQDTPAESKYTRSLASLEQWLERGILTVDKGPAVYLHDHYYRYEGREFRRRGIIARVRLEEPDSKVVRRHEGTLNEPKNDRLSLLWSLKANTSPILALYEDSDGGVASLLMTVEQNQPIIDFAGTGGDRHRVWAITGAAVVKKLRGCFVRQPLYIADGHHRYESALLYRQQRRSSGAPAGDEAFDFVLMTLVDFADPGLTILPPHRLIRGVPRAAINRLAAGLVSFFAVEELSLNTPDVWNRIDDFLAGDGGGVRLVLGGLSGQNLLLLRLLDTAATSRMMPYFHSELYKKLAVSVVDHVILEKLLGLGGVSEEIIGYSYDKRDAVRKVLDREYQLAFLLSPTRAAVVKAVADAGDRMPRKSTYFYPKVPAGLVFYRLM